VSGRYAQFIANSTNTTTADSIPAGTTACRPSIVDLHVFLLEAG
jgi:hypothetical protein